MISCPSCGQENPDGFRLCGMCGTALAAGLAAREERKVVTVLFCDLVGFTAKAERLDPEDVRAILGPYHARVRSELERYGGTVEKFIGDAVMALFGAPVAHEDDPERAVRAALAIRDFAVEEGLELRVGITTGEALVSLDASPSEGEGMASGDVVNTAARLQSAAPVNGILADETTYRSTRQRIEYGEAAPVEAKGKTEPIPVWEVVASRSRFGVDVTHEARAALVGRERELSVLRDAFERARHERTPQLVTLVAVPGMGKSRLVYELSRIVDADPELITWRQGRCLAYGDGVAFWALAEVVKAQAGISERDSEEEAAEKLRAAVEDALADVSDARWVESHLRPLVGLETDTGLGGDRRGEAFAAWRRFLEALAEQRPLVLVLEDLHWADDGLLDFVDELIDWLSDIPLLVVCSARPELFERRPGWGGGKVNSSTLGLSPLSWEQTALLISQVLERSVLPAETQQALLERSEGNPLYAEQFAQLYLERGSADDLELPETLQGIVAARLDGLSADEKAVLQDASVVGKVFWTGALRRDGDAATPLLHALERKGFLTRQRRSSVESEGEWAFAHMLLRDVAYGQIPRAERAHKHRATAEWIEGLGRSDDHAELLAFHWGSALELARAAGLDTAELATPTRLARRTAGDRAFSVNAYPAAAAYYGAALALWPEEDEKRPQLLYRFADALYVADDETALSALEDARDALLAAGERETAAEAELSLSRIWWHRGQSDTARAHQTRAEELVEGTSSRTTTRVLAFIARTKSIGGDPSQGLRLATDALAMAETFDSDELRAHALATVGISKGYLGDPTGMQDEERALELAISAHSPVAGSIANNVAVQAFFAFDLRRAGELFDEGRLIAERLGDASGVRWLRAQQASFALTLGRWDDALRMSEEFIAECEAGSTHYLEARTRADRAGIRGARGDVEGALADYRQAVTLARSSNDPQRLLPTLGDVSLAFETHGLTDEARDLAREVVDVARAHPHAAVWALPFDFLFSHFAVEFELELRDALEEAPPGPWKELTFACLDRDFVRAAEMWADAGSPTFEARSRLRATEELIETGRRAEGEAELQKALAFYRSVGATFFIQRGEQLLAEERLTMAGSRRERKVVTVVFCDLVGFTSRAEELDPEDVEALLGPYHERLRSELERHGGTVEKFIGDAVMALFGAPTAHEDDPERAVRACLAIRDWAVEQDNVQVRIAVTTGEALIRLDARPEAGEGMASGDVVNTAARLQNAAPVNGILADETTYRATRDAIDYEATAPIEAKGKSEPIPVWEATAARSRFGVDVAHEARAELVGRERELSVLRDAFERARHERTPQLVTLVGVPGIGKSRLVYELSRIADADPELITWRQGRCLAYGDGITLWALGEIVKAQAGILEQDTTDDVEAKVRSAVDEALGESTDVAWVVPHLLALLGLGAETELGGDRRNEAFSAWRRFLEGMAEQRPLVLVFEDLHWADESLLDFVDELVDWVTDVPLLVVGTARPELLERRPGWGGGKLNATTIALQPLSDEQTASLLGQLLEKPVLAAESQQRLLERAGGNPLYAEQFADLFLETGSADELPLPETLQGIIAARLDGLREDEKELLQDAAVIGKVFWASAVRPASGDLTSTLHSLERKGFVRRQKRSSLEGESEFAFAHALVRDVAYGQIARAGRAVKHQRAAEWIKSLGRPADHAEMLAHHWNAALELVRAASGVDDGLAVRARLALRDAGDRAFALHAFAPAERYFGDALALWPESDPERPDLLYRRSKSLHLAGDDRREQALEEARDALLHVGHTENAAEAEAFLAQALWYRGQRDAADDRLASARTLVADLGASAAKARILAISARFRMLAGDPEEALSIAGEALALAETLELDELRAHALNTIGSSRNALDVTTGHDEVEEALSIALGANSPTAANILNNLAVLASNGGDLRRSDELYREGQELAARFGDRDTQRFTRTNGIFIAWALGRWDEAAAAADEVIAECAVSPHYGEGMALEIRANIRLARDDAGGALEDIARALELARPIKDPQRLLSSLVASVDIRAYLGRHAEARSLAEEALALGRRHPNMGARFGQIAAVAGRLGIRHEIRSILELTPESRWKDAALAGTDGDFGRVAEIFAAHGASTLEAEGRLLDAESLIEAGRIPEGQAELGQALAFYRSVGATFFIRRGEALLAKSA